MWAAHSCSPHLALLLAVLAGLAAPAAGVVALIAPPSARALSAAAPRRRAAAPLLVLGGGGQQQEQQEQQRSPDKVAEKYGLEAGLFSALRSGGKGGGGGGDDGEGGGMAKAGDLLKRYGGAYLLTSTSLALVSFTLCYLAIDNGVDVASLLQKVNIETTSTSETVGTVGLAYAVHKAASPIRFPPTVALTPIVARKVFGQQVEEEGEAE